MNIDLYTLIKKIEDGEFGLPSIQRSFIWSKSQILDFLDSIYKNYPTSPLLLVRNDNKKFKMATNDFNPSTKKKKKKPLYYVIDGSQRLRALYNVLSQYDHEYLFNIGLDLRTKKFVFLTPSNIKRSAIINLKSIFYSDKYIENQSKMNASVKNRHYLSDINNLVSIFSNYQMNFIILEDVSSNEIIEIYGRLNRGGTKLSNEDYNRIREKKLF